MIRKLFALIQFLIALASIIFLVFGVAAVWETNNVITAGVVGHSKEEFTGLNLIFGKTNSEHGFNFEVSVFGIILIVCLAVTGIVSLFRVILPGTGGDILSGVLALTSLALCIMLFLLTQKFAITFDLDNSNPIIVLANNSNDKMYELVKGDLTIGAGAIFAALGCLANVVLSIIDTMLNRKK